MNTELDVAKAIRDGGLQGPQRYGNSLLAAMRITGTGAAYRTGLKEFVWRDPALYLNEEFLQRCQGLPVILEHPPKNMLDSEEFAKRIIGTVMLPYIRGEEVWGIARILDSDAAELIETEQLSTSPAVVFQSVEEAGERLKIENGASLLVEGEPWLIDHLALLAGPGVWDKGGPLAGVESNPDARFNARLDSVLAALERWSTGEQPAYADSARTAQEIAAAQVPTLQRQLAEAQRLAKGIPENISEGQLIEVKERDMTGRTISRFYGDPAVAWSPYQNPTRRGYIVDPRGK